MGDWSIEQRAFAVEHFFRRNDSYTLTVRDFRKRFAFSSNKLVSTEKIYEYALKTFEKLALC